VYVYVLEVKARPFIFMEVQRFINDPYLIATLLDPPHTKYEET